MSDLYSSYCRPDLGEFLKAIRLDIPYHRASGNTLYYLQNDQEVGVLDLLGGYGALILGHNHPELVRVAKDLLEKEAPIQAQASIRSASALLAKRLSDVAQSFSGETYVVTFGNSGAEAVEAAIKHADPGDPPENRQDPQGHGRQIHAPGRRAREEHLLFAKRRVE